jgi:hypothetical protein
VNDLQARLDALPEYPEPPKNIGVMRPTLGDCFRYRRLLSEALTARLALAREWIESLGYRGHDERCPTTWPKEGACTCGRDALLKAMGVPRG